MKLATLLAPDQKSRGNSRGSGKILFHAEQGRHLALLIITISPSKANECLGRAGARKRAKLRKHCKGIQL